MFKNLTTKFLLLLGILIFSVCSADAAMQLKSPANGANCVSISGTGVHFEWQYTGGTVQSYTLEVFNDTLVYRAVLPNGVTANDWVAPPAVNYSWHVIADLGVVAGKDTSDTFTFTSSLSPDIVPVFEALPNDSACLHEDNGLLIEWTYSGQGNIRYELEWSYNAAFAPSTAVQTIATAYAVEVGTWNAGSKVYYRVRAVSNYDAACVSGWSEVDTVTVFAAPDIPEYSDLSIPDGDNCTAISPVLKWEKETDTDKAKTLKYFIQVAENATFATNVTTTYTSKADSIKVLLTKFNYTYYWRLYAMDTLSGCISYFSVPRSFTTQPAPPTLLSPANGAKGAEVFAEGMDKDVVLTWKYNGSSEDVYSFKVQIATASNFAPSNMLVDDISTDTAYSFNLSALDVASNSDIYWRVATVNELECASAWSTTFNFKTPFDAPEAIYPNIHTACFNNAAFKWTKVEDAEGYEIYLADNQYFNGAQSIVIDTNIDSAYVELPTYEAIFYWKIRVMGEDNDGYWSNTLSFKSPVLPPALLSPANNAVNVPLKVTLQWKMRSDSSNYRVQIATADDFTAENILIDSVVALPLTATEAQLIANLPSNNKVYYWRVASLLTKGNKCASDFSAAYSFRTLLSTPTLLLPENDDSLKLATVTFEWTEVADAMLYDLEFSLDSTFNTTESVYGIPYNYHTEYILTQDTTYYWRVKARNQNLNSNWSSVFKFHSGKVVPTVPVLVSPANYAKSVETTPKFIWRIVQGSVEYNIEYSMTNNFSEDVISINVADTTYTVPAEDALEHYATYYWRVRAKNANDIYGTWSTVWSFKVVNEPPTAAVVLLTPADNADNVNKSSASFTWHEVFNAHTYTFQVATDANFANLVIDLTQPNMLQYSAMNKFTAKTKYYWRVRANNEGGSAPWSAVWSFTTMDDGNIIDNTVLSAVNISPNPANTNAVVKFNMLNSADVIISIYDAFGNEVYSISDTYDAGSNSAVLNVSHLASGSYIFRAISNGKIIATDNFIIIK